MTTVRWWDLVFVGTLAIMAVVACFAWAASDADRMGALVTLGVIGICYFAFGRRGLNEQRASVAFRIVLILGCGVAAYFSPNLATLQAFAFPFLWALTASLRGCIVLSGLLATSVGIGLTVGQGGSPDALARALGVESLSFVFAVALGLWITRIALDGERNRALLDHLTAAQGELGEMHRTAGRASEREALARDIHDTIAQSLTSLVMLAERAQGELAAMAADTTRADATAQLIEATARDALTEARGLVASMSPVRDESTLAETVARLASHFAQETGIQVDAAVTATDLDRELEVVLLRCAQEGLANVRKHSRASVAAVTIAATHGVTTLEVRDNGRGFAAGGSDGVASASDASGAGTASTNTANTATGGFGLAGMRDRVGLVGGTLDVGPGADGGTVLRVSLPAEEESR